MSRPTNVRSEMILQAALAALPGCYDGRDSKAVIAERAWRIGEEFVKYGEEKGHLKGHSS